MAGPTPLRALMFAAALTILVCTADAGNLQKPGRKLLQNCYTNRNGRTVCRGNRESADTRLALRQSAASQATQGAIRSAAAGGGTDSARRAATVGSVTSSCVGESYSYTYGCGGYYGRRLLAKMVKLVWAH